MRHILILGICSCLFVIACEPGAKEIKSIKKQLVGTWQLDSFTQPNNNFYKSALPTRLTFVSDADFSYQVMNGEGGNTFSGKYYVLDNPKRGLKTIACIPDIEVSGQDTVRIPYIHFDIVSLDSGRLYVVDETTSMMRDSLEPITYTKYSVFKRTE